MARDRMKVWIVWRIATALLLGTLLSPLHAQDDTRTREEVLKACEAKVKEGRSRYAAVGIGGVPAHRDP